MIPLISGSIEIAKTSKDFITILVKIEPAFEVFVTLFFFIYRRSFIWYITVQKLTQTTAALVNTLFTILIRPANFLE